MKIQFSEKAEKTFQEIISHYPKREAALLPVLWLAQDEFKFLSREVQEYVAKRVEVSLSKVEGVISFYTLYNKEPKGTYHVQLCKNISCYLRGCKDIMDTIEEELQLKPGQTSKDGLFSYSHVECLAACDKAPCMQVNFDYHDNLTKESTVQLLRGLKNGKNSK